MDADHWITLFYFFQVAKIRSFSFSLGAMPKVFKPAGNYSAGSQIILLA
jgi:hypothetical protein